MNKAATRLLMKAYGALALGDPATLRRLAGELSSHADCSAPARALFSYLAFTIIPAFLELAIACGFIWAQGLPWAALGTLAAAGAILAISLLAGPKAAAAAKRHALSQGATRARSIDLLGSFCEAKSLGREAESLGAFALSAHAEADRLTYGKRLDQAIDASFLLASGAGAAITFLLGSMALLDGSIGPAQFISAMSMATLALGPVSQLGWSFRELGNAGAQISLALDIIDAPQERQDGVDPAEAELAPGAPLAEAILATSLADDGAPILRGASLRIAPGEKIALVGPSGSGKTTLANLFLQFAPLDSGELLLRGVPVAAARPAAWRRLVGWVPQSPRPTMTTPLDFLRMADPALGADGARRLMASLALDLDPEAPVGPGARPLSGGQWQRLACARALSTPSQLLILDEASSALDADSESLLMRAALSDPRAVLAITHRLGHAKLFDKVAFMVDGAVVQCGPHRELIEQPGPYRDLWNASREGFV